MTNLTDMLQPLAEATVPCPEIGNGGYHARVISPISDGDCPHCAGSGTIPDPRFAALRGEHDIDGGGRGERCHGCDWSGPEGTSEGLAPYCLDTSLGSIVKAAAACDLFVASLTYETLGPGKWSTELRPWKHSEFHEAMGHGDTPEEAAIMALIAAVGEQNA